MAGDGTTKFKWLELVLKSVSVLGAVGQPNKEASRDFRR